MDKRKTNRREFIRDVSVTGLGLAVGPTLLSIGAKEALAQGDMSKLVIATHDAAVSGVQVNADIAQMMVDAGMMQYTGEATVADAWASVLTGFSPHDLVTIKVNCINSSLPSHKQVVDGIVAGLIAAGVKDNNIIIWDRTNRELTNCGYSWNTAATGVRCFGTNEDGWGYGTQVNLDGSNVLLSKILTSSDHLINVPVLKDHSRADVTLSMKNHYGSIDNPGILHGNSCDPYIGELSNVPEIKDKTRMIVLDACLGLYSGGPYGPPQFVHNSLVFGQDPVALDYQGWQILQAERQKHGLALAQPDHIETAANMGLGTNDPDQIHVEMLNLGGQAVSSKGKTITTWGNIKKW